MSRETLGIPEVSLRNLKSALYVSEFKNVTRAAIKLNRSQTAVTKAVCDLEQALGVQLFDRSSAGMMPTVYGEALAHRVSLAQDEFRKAGESYAEFTNRENKFQSISIFTMDISYKRLSAFIALFETHDIGGAAASLNVTKAAVYNSVRQMEELLEMDLFEREPNGVTPTAFSRVLARHIKLAFSQIRHAIEDLASLNGIMQGSVVIGTLPYTRTFLTPRAINRLLVNHPQLDVTTQEGPYHVLEAALRCGDLDFIVGATRETPVGSDITTEVLLEDRLSVIARKGHPLSKQDKIQFSDLQDVHWVLPTKQTPTRKLFDETLVRHSMHQPAHSVETSSLSMVRGLLVDSDRVALLSEHQIHYDKQYGILDVLPVELKETYRPIGMTMRAHTQPSPAAQLFLEEIRIAVKELKSSSS